LVFDACMPKSLTNSHFQSDALPLCEVWVALVRGAMWVARRLARPGRLRRLRAN
jgi:hypothetical protein